MMLGRRSIFLISLLSCALLAWSMFTPSTAAGNEKSVQLTPAYNFYFAGFHTFLFWNGEIYANLVNYSETEISFSNVSLGAPTNPSQSFGVASDFANATLLQISQNQTVISLTGLTSHYGFLYYYYSSNGSRPLQVSIGSFKITYDQFKTNEVVFDSSSKAVFWNPSANYILIKTPSAQHITISYVLGPTSASHATEFLVIGISIVAVAAIVIVLLIRRERKKSESQETKEVPATHVLQ